MYLVLETISSLKKGVGYDPAIPYVPSIWGQVCWTTQSHATISDKVAQLERNSWSPTPFFYEISTKIPFFNRNLLSFFLSAGGNVTVLECCVGK